MAKHLPFFDEERQDTTSLKSASMHFFIVENSPLELTDVV